MHGASWVRDTYPAFMRWSIVDKLESPRNYLPAVHRKALRRKARFCEVLYVHMCIIRLIAGFSALAMAYSVLSCKVRNQTNLFCWTP